MCQHSNENRMKDYRNYKNLEHTVKVSNLMILLYSIVKAQNMENGKLATIIAQNFDGRQFWQVILLPKIFWQINIDRLPALLSKPTRKSF